jgi:hypothetical protein
VDPLNVRNIRSETHPKKVIVIVIIFVENYIENAPSFVRAPKIFRSELSGKTVHATFLNKNCAAAMMRHF